MVTENMRQNVAKIPNKLIIIVPLATVLPPVCLYPLIVASLPSAAAVVVAAVDHPDQMPSSDCQPRESEPTWAHLFYLPGSMVESGIINFYIFKTFKLSQPAAQSSARQCRPSIL